MHISFAIEGVDGVGKTSIARELATYFNRNQMLKDFDVSLFREPGGTWVGEIARQQILYPMAPSHKEIGHMTNKLCYVLSHSELMYECKRTEDTYPDSVIILDRYSPMSNMVYERYERKNEIGWMVTVYGRLQAVYKPDLVFVLDPADKEAEQACIERSMNERDNSNVDDFVADERKLARMEGYRAFAKTKTIHPGIVLIPFKASDTVYEIATRIENYVLEMYFGDGHE